MLWAKIVLVAWYMLALGISIVLHGKETKYHCGHTAVSFALVALLLWLGGFFE